jgi:hypothetical protein
VGAHRENPMKRPERSVQIPSLGPYETRDERRATTKLRVYELPDWQNLVPDVQITSPQ